VLKPSAHVVVHVVILLENASNLDGAVGWVRTLELKSMVSALSGRDVSEFGTVRPKEAKVLRAKLTAILSDGGNRQRTSGDPG
jgi:hypothetical protein